MSSGGTGRRDPARVPSAALRNRILARSRLPVLIVMLAIGYGTVGYWLVEGKNVLDAFYATVLVLSTLGVEAAPPPDPGGKVFTVSVILFGVVALFTAIGVGTEVVASGELGRWLRMNQAARSISRLSGHYVTCGYGRVGRAVLEDLRRRDYISGGSRAAGVTVRATFACGHAAARRKHDGGGKRMCRSKAEGGRRCPG